MAGFDTCTAPSLAAMKAWRAKYAAANIYIGGQEMACDYGNLSKSWVQAGRGHGLVADADVRRAAGAVQQLQRRRSTRARPRLRARPPPTRPCRTRACSAWAQGTPIYFDMEAYNENNSGCVTAVLTFLDAWTGS